MIDRLSGTTARPRKRLVLTMKSTFPRDPPSLCRSALSAVPAKSYTSIYQIQQTPLSALQAEHRAGSSASYLDLRAERHYFHEIYLVVPVRVYGLEKDVAAPDFVSDA